MRKHIGIGVVAAALLFGLAAPSVNGAARSDHVVAAGVGTGMGETIERGLQRGLEDLLRLLGRARLNPAEVDAATVSLKGLIPTVLRTPAGEQRELGPWEWWELVDVACTTKDASDLLREPDINVRLNMLEAELPGAFGARQSVRNLADDMAKAKSTGDKVRIAATAGICATANEITE